MGRLKGRVFHATKQSRWREIGAVGRILPSGDGKVRGAFGSYDAYFRNRGCVSVFDLASPSTEEIHDHLSSCHPVGAVQPEDGGVYLFLGPTARSRLISWCKCGEEGAHAEMVVPYVEAGHPGPISLADIEEVLEVELTDYPEHLQLMRELSSGRSRGGATPTSRCTGR